MIYIVNAKDHLSVEELKSLQDCAEQYLDNNLEEEPRSTKRHWARIIRKLKHQIRDAK